MNSPIFNKFTDRVVNRYMEKIKTYNSDYINLNIVELCHLLGKIEDLRSRLNYIDQALLNEEITEVDVACTIFKGVNGAKLRRICREVFDKDGN